MHACTEAALLNDVVSRDRYAGKPYALALAMGGANWSIGHSIFQFSNAIETIQGFSIATTISPACSAFMMSSFVQEGHRSTTKSQCKRLAFALTTT